MIIMQEEYTTVKFPKRLIEEVDSILGYHGYTSRAQFVEDAVKRRLKEIRK